MRLTFPLPNPKLNPNRSNGLHWSKTSDLRKKAKALGYYGCLEAMAQQKHVNAKQYSLEIIFVLGDHARHDRDNLLASCKSLLDGVALALGVDDNDFEPVILRRAYDKGHPSMSIEILATDKEKPLPDAGRVVFR